MRRRCRIVFVNKGWGRGVYECARKRGKVVFLEGNKRTSVHYLQRSAFVPNPKASLKMISNLFFFLEKKNNVHLPFGAPPTFCFFCYPKRTRARAKERETGSLCIIRDKIYTLAETRRQTKFRKILCFSFAFWLLILPTAILRKKRNTHTRTHTRKYNIYTHNFYLLCLFTRYRVKAYKYCNFYRINFDTRVSRSNKT